jgi:hypothetical protein
MQNDEAVPSGRCPLHMSNRFHELGKESISSSWSTRVFALTVEAKTSGRTMRNTVRICKDWEARGSVARVEEKKIFFAHFGTAAR